MKKQTIQDLETAALHIRLNLNDFDGVLFDLDGTIYYGEKIIDGANDIIQFFESRERRFSLQQIIRLRLKNRYMKD